MGMKDNYFRDGWEDTREFQFVTYNHCRRKAYVCSPLGAADREQYLANMHAARAYMLLAAKTLGYAARAPHAYLPMLLSDDVPAERALAKEFGIRLLEQSDVLLVCGDNISGGMAAEIVHAAGLRMEIRVFDDSVYLETKKLVTKNGGDKSQVVLDRTHPRLACRYPMEEWEYREAV